MLVDLLPYDADLTGVDAEVWLESAGIITNKNGIPQDPRPPRVTSGLRLGTPATTTRGMGPDQMATIGGWFERVLGSKGDEATINRVRSEVRTVCDAFPMPGVGEGVGV